MPIDLTDRGDAFREFWTENRAGALATIRADGTPHLVPVGVTVDFAAGIARVVSPRASYKVRNVAAGKQPVVAVCQVEGLRWSTLEGRVVIRDEPAEVADAEQRYAERYAPPRPNPTRVVLEITVTKVLGNV